MFGSNKDTCWTCGADFLTGCVISGECPDCEGKRLALERAGWKRAQGGMFGLDDRRWEDPKFPGTVYPEPEALKIQEGRDLEGLKTAQNP
jgi:DNA-directed RNA polymerase subunit RPC12/RpoP